MHFAQTVGKREHSLGHSHLLASFCYVIYIKIFLTNKYPFDEGVLHPEQNGICNI